MSNNYFKIKKGIQLDAQSGSTITTAGDMAFRSDTEKLEVFTTTAENIATDINTLTLTNKTLSGNIATNLVNGTGVLDINSSGTITIPNATDTLVGKATTDTLTNKSISGSTNTFSNIPNAATTATNLNTASTIVARDASGNFSAGTITAALSGNATTATTAGNVSGTVAIANGGTGQTSASAAFDALSPTTTKGDLIAHDTNNVRLAVGSDDQVLTANSTASSGLSWLNIPSQSFQLYNLGISSSVASNNLTIALKQSDGATDPGGGPGQVKIGYRNATATTGGYTIVSSTAATSIVLHSGSTLGMASGVTYYIYVYAINNAGTTELAVSLADLDEGITYNTTAEGNGTATTNYLLYSTTARTAVPIRKIGRLTINEATAGTYASDATVKSVLPFETRAMVAQYYCSAPAASSLGAGINFDTKVYDTHNMIVTGTWKAFAPVAGYWKISIQGYVATSGTTLELFKNGSDNNQTFASWTTTEPRGSSMTVLLAAGDYIDVRLATGQNTGSGRSVFFEWAFIGRDI